MGKFWIRLAATAVLIDAPLALAASTSGLGLGWAMVGAALSGMATLIVWDAARPAFDAAREPATPRRALSPAIPGG